ncbi:putative nucleic acid-binding protein [Trueperella bonasi]|uniref:Nucleic acid-binding protein n=1 Tax=Trueperella bonasi TaxID=312286 RepID=A0ABT9NI29_9ACTO|nr:type II toxin-antitoxin system VapC family toxin [Trueperella bonasi]MDP9806847.1 putative nucleic acid-binding protein [Trueperella bonasi]
MTLYYLDTSVAIMVLQGHPGTVHWFTEAAEHADLVSSRILQTEITPVLRRESRPPLERDEILDFVALVPVSETILQRAESIQSHVRTLDAIHLATAGALPNATVVSHDNQMLLVASDLAMRTLDPVL